MVMGGGGEADSSPVKRKVEDDSSSDDEPIANIKKKQPAKSVASKKSVKREDSSDESDDEPIANLKKKKPVARKTPTKSKSKPAKKTPAKKRKKESSSDESSDDEPISTIKKKKPPPKKKKTTKSSGNASEPKPKKIKKEEIKIERKFETRNGVVWEWCEQLATWVTSKSSRWKLDELPEGQKWKTLKHNGPKFPPEYEPLPKSVVLLYNGKPFPLEPAAEEVAGFYAVMLKTDYIQKPVFNKNFFTCWKKTMTADERKILTDLKRCDFSRIQAHYVAKSEARKNATKEEKKARKEREDTINQNFIEAELDGVKQKVGNYTLEPPGLFRGRGEHPLMGMLKQRIRAEDVTINIGKLDDAPEAPKGSKWGEIKSDNTVTWMAAWKENIAGGNKYMMFNAESYMKARSDLKKYETARNLHSRIDKIREDYTRGLQDKVMQDRQRSTALYFIDKLALRAGGEKNTDEEADTVGCCNLRVEHVFAEDDNKVRFDFLGKDSMRYTNVVEVSKQVHKNVQIFKRGKEEGDDLFDRLTVPMLNKYLQSLMPGLTAKVFRTYNASITLQRQLENTPVDGSVDEKFLAYQRANRMVAILCNHQRTAPKGFEEQVGKMDTAMEEIQKKIKEAKKERKEAKGKDRGKLDAINRKIATLELRLHKKEIQKTDKEENKTIALGTSKLNYLDPRISIAWCRKFDTPIEKVYNKTQRLKFQWAVQMTEKDFKF